jgi:ligand-binding sensor domain-containing protein
MVRKIFLLTATLLLITHYTFSQTLRGIQNIGLTEITIIEEAYNNDIWVGSASQGVAYYNATNQTWSYYNTGNTPQFKSDSITSISFGVIGGVQHAFFGTTNGLIYNHGGPWDTLALASTSLGDRFITGVSLIGSDTLWASTRNGLLAYDTSTLQIAKIYNTTNSNVPYNHTITSARHGQACSIYAAGTPDSGIFFTSNAGTTFTKIDTTGADFKLVDNRVNAICIDNNCTRMMIGTMGGLSICPVGIPCQSITIANGLPENNVTSVSEDCHGYIWIGTPDSGIVVLNGQGSAIVGRITVANGLTNNQITSISFAGGDCVGYVSMGDGNLAVVDTNYQVTQTINGLNAVNQSGFDVKVYPQPSSGQITFLFGSELTDGNIYLTDISGRPVRNISINNTSIVNTDVSTLSEGLYFYIISSGSLQLKTGKLLVSNK